MSGILTTVFFLSLVPVAGMFALAGYLVIIRKNPAATIIAVALAGIFLVGRVALLTGGGSGVWLAASPGPAGFRVVTGVGGGIMLGLGLLSTVGAVRGRRWSRRMDRVLSQAEVLELIRSGAVSSFLKYDGKVVLNYTVNQDANGEWLWRPSAGDPTGYAAYVAAAKEVEDRFRITYHNDSGPNDPNGPGSRWIGPEEAAELLGTGRIRSFTAGLPEPFPAEPVSGPPTGIKFIDFGWVRHIWVESALRPALLPVAEQAHGRHGRPYITVDGRHR